MTQVLLVDVDPGLVERMRALPEHRVVSIDRGNAAQIEQVATDAAGFEPDLIIVGSNISVDKGLEYATSVLAADPMTTVVLEAEPDRGLIRKATRAGIRGVISAGISDVELDSLLQRSAVKPDAGQDKPHRVVVVASPKGGVGKTTTTVSLAALLAEEAPNDVVLLDLDLQFGDVAAVLDLQPQYTVTDAFASGSGDSMLLRTLLTPHDAGFYVLCGSEHPAENGNVTGDEIRKLISQMSSIFRFVVVDTAAGLHEDTLSSLEEASDVVLLSTPDIATLRAVRKEVDVLAELRLLPHRRHVVLNRKTRTSGLTVRDSERVLGLPVDVVVDENETVGLSANHGTLAVAQRKRNRVRKNFQDLTERIVSSKHDPLRREEER